MRKCMRQLPPQHSGFCLVSAYALLMSLTTQHHSLHLVVRCRWANCPDLLSSAASSNSHSFPPLVVCELSPESQQPQQHQQQRPCDFLFNRLLAADSGSSSVVGRRPWMFCVRVCGIKQILWLFVWAFTITALRTLHTVQSRSPVLSHSDTCRHTAYWTEEWLSWAVVNHTTEPTGRFWPSSSHSLCLIASGVSTGTDYSINQSVFISGRSPYNKQQTRCSAIAERPRCRVRYSFRQK